MLVTFCLIFINLEDFSPVYQLEERFYFLPIFANFLMHLNAVSFKDRKKYILKNCAKHLHNNLSVVFLPLFCLCNKIDFSLLSFEFCCWSPSAWFLSIKEMNAKWQEKFYDFFPSSFLTFFRISIFVLFRVFFPKSLTRGTFFLLLLFLSFCFCIWMVKTSKTEETDKLRNRTKRNKIEKRNFLGIYCLFCTNGNMENDEKLFISSRTERGRP